MSHACLTEDAARKLSRNFSIFFINFPENSLNWIRSTRHPFVRTIKFCEIDFGETPREEHFSPRDAQLSRAFTATGFYLVDSRSTHARDVGEMPHSTASNTYVIVRPLCLENNMARSLTRYRCILTQNCSISALILSFSVLHFASFSQDHL
jgi:hypothetical protein